MDSSAATAAPPARLVSRREKFQFHLEEPADWSAPKRHVRCTGWCVAASGKPLTAIRAVVRRKIFESVFDRYRPDVLEHLEMLEATPYCGFDFEITVPPGKTSLRLEVAGTDRQWRRVFSTELRGPLVESRAERERWCETVRQRTRQRFDVWFDRPQDWSRPSDTLYIAGWCVERGGNWIRAIRARVGSEVFAGNFGIERKDVASVYPQFRAARYPGFAVAAKLPAGRSVVTVEVQIAGGEWQTIATHEVIGDPATSTEIPAHEIPLFVPRERESRFRFWFDRPSNWDQKVRHQHLAGWVFAIDGEPALEVRARIGKRIFPVNYGILRPDIAVIFEGQPRALQSGFAGEIVVPPGPHMFVLEAKSANGLWEPFFSRRIRGPLLWPERDKDIEAVGNYREWVRRFDTLTRRDRATISQQIAQLERRPLISVLLPIFNTNPRWLRRAIESVRAQLYDNWELCVVDDASTDPRIWKLLLRYARRDRRIKVQRRATNGHIAATSNDALALATGDYLALLDHDDELAPAALYSVALELNRWPDAQVVYTDEDKLDARGNRTDPYFKPDWNPDLFSSQNYISHLGVYASPLVRRAGGFRVGFEGSQDYDLLWRCLERVKPAQIRHIPHVLYHWRIAEESTATFALAKPYAQQAAIRATQEHFDRTGNPAVVEQHYANYLRVRYALPANPPLVSIVIPTRDRADHLRRCVESIVAKTDYARFEIIILDNESSEPATLDYFEEVKRRRAALIHRIEGAFNFSRLNNHGVALATGAVVALLNNDLEVKNSDWLSEMVSHALRPEVGAVGARLWYPDGTMQHGGVILGAGGVASHAHAGIRNEHGYFARAHLTQNFSAVTAACMVLRKSVYESLGGLDEVNLPVAFNDVDFCLRLSNDGLHVVWTPHAELFHYESASRGLEDTAVKQRRFLAEVDYMERRWRDRLSGDPAYNPNLSIASNELFKLAFPPRIAKPWEKTV
ncbi:MAG: glycosyltransferase [Chthoniobacterales bacterium]